VTATLLQIAARTDDAGEAYRVPLLIKKIAEAEERRAGARGRGDPSAACLASEPDTIRQGLTLVTHSAGGTAVFAGSSVDAAASPEPPRT
jgi:hypothetical protein